MLFTAHFTLYRTRTDQGAYWNNVFAKPWCRVAAFCVGIALGYVLKNWFHKKINKVIQCCFALIVFMLHISLHPCAQATSFNLTSRIGLHKFQNFKPFYMHIHYQSRNICLGGLSHLTKPGIPFLGHRQTLQTQIRRHRTRRLTRIYTVCSQEFLSKYDKNEKSTPDTL